jgi:hypothetical protein
VGAATHLDNSNVGHYYASNPGGTYRIAKLLITLGAANLAQNLQTKY